MNELSIQELFSQLQKEAVVQAPPRTALFVGDRGSGKSSLVKYLKGESDQDLKQTDILSFSYIKSVSKRTDWVYCYDLEGSQLLASLIQDIYASAELGQVCFVVVADLSRPGTAKAALVKWLEAVRRQSEAILQKRPQEERERHLRQVQLKFERHPDGKFIRPMPFQTVIVGTKYDLFKSFDNELKKWVIRLFRYIALTNGCSLTFHSRAGSITQDSKPFLVSLLSGEEGKRSNVDYQQPVYVSQGQDSVAAMDLPRSQSQEADLLEAICETVQQRLRKEKEERPAGTRVDWEQYREPRLDQLIAGLINSS